MSALGTAGRRLVLVLGWGLVLGFGALTWPVQLGGGTGYVIVAGGSMAGTYESGDLVVTRSAPGYEVGQVVVFSVPEGEPGEGMRVVHRITDGDGETGYTTRGDALDSDDPWQPQDDDVWGAAVLHFPGAGDVLSTLLHPIVLAALAGGLATAAVLSKPARPEEAVRVEP